MKPASNKSISLKANAKINIGLDIVGKRPDGYHELRTVMQTVGLYDTVFIKKTDKYKLKLITNLKWMPTDKRNLVYRAATFLIDEFKVDGGVFIELTKNIPTSAGLGGGSSDCAATLIGMRNLFKIPLSNTELIKIAQTFGADVPYCVMRGTALAEGTGERLLKLPPHPNAYVLLAKPSANISTADVFSKLKFTAETAHPDIDAIVDGLRVGSLIAIASALGNTLENITVARCPDISKLKQLMLDNSALGAQMSGSGPTVFGYFRDRGEMQKAAAAIAREMPHVTGVYPTYIYNPV